MAAVIGQPGTTERVRLPRFEYLIEALAEHNRPIFRIERGFHPEHGKEWFRAETLKGDVAEGNSIEEAVGALLLHVLYAES